MSNGTFSFVILSWVAFICFFCIIPLAKRSKRKQILYDLTGFELLNKKIDFLKYHKFTKKRDYDYVHYSPQNKNNRSQYTTYNKFNRGILIDIIFKETGISNVVFKPAIISSEKFEKFKAKNIDKAKKLGLDCNKFGFYENGRISLSFHENYFMIRQKDS